MPTVLVADVAKVELLSTFQDRQCVNVLHVREGAEPTTDLMGMIASAVADQWTSTQAGGVVESFVLNTIRVTDLTTSTGPQAEQNVNIPGTSSATGSTVERCAVITELTDVRSPRARGRIYQAGIAEGAFSSGGELTADAIVGIRARWNDFMALLTTAGFAMTVVSAVDMVDHPVTGFRVNPVAGIQRRRLRN